MGNSGPMAEGELLTPSVERTQRSRAVEAIPREAWYALFITSCAQFFVSFDATALNVAFSSIEKSFSDVPRTTLAWTLTSYSIGTASLLLLAGRLADLFGRKRIFLVGISAFAVGSLAAGLSPHVGLLIASRAIQSVGGALMLPTSLALALPGFPASRRSLAVAIWGSFAALAGGIGPPAGAGLIALGGWRAIFFINIPVVLIVVLLGRKYLKESSDIKAGARLDLISVPLGSIALASITLAVLEGEKWGWTSTPVLSLFIGSLVIFVIVVMRSRSHPQPLLDLPLFRRRRFTGAAVTTFLFNAPTSGFWFATPLFMQTIWGWSVLKSGMALVPTPVVVFAAANLSGRLSDRGMIKRMVTAGIVLVIASAIGMYYTLGATPNYWAGYFPFSVLYGLALGLSWSTITAAALVGVEPQRYGAANGTVVTFRTIGSAMGVAAVIAVSSTGGEHGSVASFHRVYLAIALAFAAALAVWLFAYPKDERRR